MRCLDLVARADVLFLTGPELAALTQTDEWRSAAAGLCGTGRLHAVVVKLGPRGAACVTASGITAMEAVPVTAVVDPTGAGDALAGGFLGQAAQAERDDESQSSRWRSPRDWRALPTPSSNSAPVVCAGPAPYDRGRMATRPRDLGTPIDRNLALELVRVTEGAAMAAARHMGRNQKEMADQAAVELDAAEPRLRRHGRRRRHRRGREGRGADALYRRAGRQRQPAFGRRRRRSRSMGRGS